MNQGGLPYRISNAPNFDTDELSKSYEYFDMYSLPIKTLYSQVHWTSHGPIKFPDHIIERFQDGKVMALMGYEVDQVRIDPETGREESVPITWAYNHHYMVVSSTLRLMVVEFFLLDASLTLWLLFVLDFVIHSSYLIARRGELLKDQ
jgi:hypothetical protein